MSLISCKQEFSEMIFKLSKKNQLAFLDWIGSEFVCEPADKEEIILREIALELQPKVPTSGVLSTEVIFKSDQEEEKPTMHIDEFLFGNEDLDRFGFNRHYCVDCGSRNTEELVLISHSCSIERMRFIFKALLPPLDNMVFLDVGSRLGAVLFGAYLYSKANKIIGVEMNRELCQLADYVVSKWSMADRIDVVCADICTQQNLISSANVILISNAFEYFAGDSIGVQCWRIIYKYVQPGAILIMSPKAETTFRNYPIGVPWREWLIELPMHDAEALSVDDMNHFQAGMAAYRVSFSKKSESFWY